VSTPLRLLVVEDFPPDAELILAEVRRAGYEPAWTVVDTAGKFLRALDDQPEIVICDYTLPTMTAPDALAILQSKAPDLPLIVVSGTMDEATCVNSLRLGAADYLLKDRLSRLGPAIEHALSRRELDRVARATEQERRQTMNILKGLVDNSVAAISVRNLMGSSLIANDAYRRVHAADAPQNPPVVVSDLDPAEVMEQEEQYDVDGETHTFYSVRYPVSDHTDQVFAVGAILVDITQQKRIEEDLRKARAQLEKRAEHLDAANAELRELDRLKTEFVASVSHELRTPLTSIRGYVELLLDEVEDQSNQQGRMLGIIDRNANRLLNLIEDLLLLSKVDSRTLAHEVEPFDLAELADGALVVLQPAAESAQITLKQNLGRPLPVEGDRSQLERVLFNLLSNAVKFSRPGGTVELGARIADDKVVLTVTDTGLGISAEELPKLFNRFFRSASDAAHKIPGTGLGLAVVREIVENHGGQVKMDSVLDQGSTVTVTLPMRSEQLTQPGNS
jgi:signal transduction histidine kinase